MVRVNIKVQRSYDQETLLNDHSINWKGFDREALMAAARREVPSGFILVGSGITEANVRDLLTIADGAIVGTSLKKDGIITNPLDPLRVKAMAGIFMSF